MACPVTVSVSVVSSHWLKSGCQAELGFIIPFSGCAFTLVLWMFPPCARNSRNVLQQHHKQIGKKRQPNRC